MPVNVPVAQGLEHNAYNVGVDGSNPSWRTNMNSKQQFILPTNVTKTRLDVFLSEEMDSTRSQIKKMIDRGQVSVNGELPKKSGDNIKAGDIVVVDTEKKVENVPSMAQEKSLADFDVQIIKETKDYIVVNKPAGLLIHPTEADEPVSLAAWMLEKYPEIKNVGDSKVRPGIVHRLDKEASGLLVVARKQKMFDHLKKQCQQQKVLKLYIFF